MAAAQLPQPGRLPPGESAAVLVRRRRAAGVYQSLA